MALRGKWIADLLSQVGRLTVSLDYANEKVPVCNKEKYGRIPQCNRYHKVT